jgi:hypothetical protein
MGRTNLDRLSVRDFRWTCDTVTQMRERNWEVIGHCEACGLQMLVSLRVVAATRGPKFSLWNRKVRCKRLLCAGWMRLKARMPGKDWHEALECNDGTLPPA